MESLDTAACFMDDLLDFSSDIGEEEDDDEKSHHNHRLLHHQHHRNNRHPAFPLLPCRDAEYVEEELEWISNKDAFPMVESLADFIPNHPSIATSNSNSITNHRSPISVLENSASSFNSNLSHGSVNNNNNNSNGNMMLINLSSNFKVPGKARSKHGRKRRRDLFGQQFQCWSFLHDKASKKHSSSSSVSSKPSSTLGRKCLHCGAEKTPQWRAGPLGPKTLCNACGVRYKSGRLCAEYRPASSPTFSSELHSNSHRKIIEMRRQKMPLTGSGFKPAEIG